MPDTFKCVTSIELKGDGCPDLTLGVLLNLPFAPTLGGCLHWPAGEGMLQLQIVALSWSPASQEFWMILGNAETQKPIKLDDMLELQQFLRQFGFEDAKAKAEQASARLDNAVSNASKTVLRDAMGQKPGKIVHAKAMPVN